MPYKIHQIPLSLNEQLSKMMKKLFFYLIFLVSMIVRSANPPPPGLPDDPVAAPIDSMIFILFIAGIAFGSYTIYKKK
jgi:hypothetical protein